MESATSKKIIMEVSGRVKVIAAEQQISASFKKREIVITTDEQYPQVIMVEFTQDKTDLLNNYAIGDEVKISINIRGREWVSPQGETKYFNSIQGWRIEKMTQNAEGQAPPPPMPAAPFPPAGQFTEKEEDDLPF